jgi:hypothetical protein
MSIENDNSDDNSENESNITLNDYDNNQIPNYKPESQSDEDSSSVSQS